MSKSFFITCDEATLICDKSQYGEATFFEKLKLKIHFLRCKICSLYTKQNCMITKICDQHLKNKKHEEHSLSAKEKEKLKDFLKNN